MSYRRDDDSIARSTLIDWIEDDLDNWANDDYENDDLLVNWENNNYES